MTALKTILKILAGILGALAAIFIIVIIALQFVNWDKYRDNVASLIEKHSDYKVQKFGSLDIDVSFSPRLALETFELQRTAETTALSRFSAKEVDLRVELLPLLFKNQLRIKHAKLIDSEIILQPVSADEAPAKPVADEKPAEIPALFLQAAEIRNTSLVLYSEQEKDADPMIVIVEELLAYAAADSQPVQLKGHGSLAKLAFYISGELGSRDQFIESGDSYPISIKTSMLDNHLAINGSLDVANGLQDFDSHFTGHGSALSKLAGAFGVKVGEIPPYKFAWKAVGTLQDIEIKDLDFTLGESHIYGDSTIELEHARPYVRMNIGASAIRIKDLTSFTPDSEEGQNQAEEEVAAGPIFSEEPLPVDILKLLDADLRLAVAEIKGGYPGQVLTGLVLEASLNNGRLHVSELDVASGDGSLGGELLLDSQASPMTLEGELGIKDLQLANLVRPFIENVELVDMKAEDLIAGRLAGDISINTNGQSPKQLASHLNGKIQFALEEGQISATAFRALGIDFPKTISSWLEGNPVTRIDCMVATFEAKEGHIGSDAMLIATPEYNVLANGTLNLPEEQLSFRIETRAKDFSIGSTQSPIEIGGPLQDIGVKVLTDELLARIGAAALGALVNPALAAAPFVDLGLAEEGKCGEFVQTIQKIEDKGEEKVSH